MYNADRIIACLKLLLKIIDGYVIEYDTYREDDYINIINSTISLYDDIDEPDKLKVTVLEFNVDDYDVWIDMISKFINVLKELDFSEEFPIYDEKNDKELIFNAHDAMDILEHIGSISKENVDLE